MSADLAKTVETLPPARDYLDVRLSMWYHTSASAPKVANCCNSFLQHTHHDVESNLAENGSSEPLITHHIVGDLAFVSDRARLTNISMFAKEAVRTHGSSFSSAVLLRRVILATV